MDKFEREARLSELHTENRSLCKISSGMDWAAEEIANHILAKGRQGVVAHSALRDYLSDSQLELRRSREIYPSQGFPEKNLFSGMYRRAYNPNTRGERSSKATPNLEADPLDHE